VVPLAGAAHGQAGSQCYRPGVDVWAVGCVMAKLLAGEPLFVHVDTENDMLMEVLHLRHEIESMGLQAIRGLPEDPAWLAVLRQGRQGHGGGRDPAQLVCPGRRGRLFLSCCRSRVPCCLGGRVLDAQHSLTSNRCNTPDECYNNDYCILFFNCS
jgi:hypothetical protein